MIYKQFNPHPALAGYIAAYWTAKGDGIELKKEKILPDGCVDIIFNLGADCKTANGTYTLHNEKVYLVGTTTRFIEVNMNTDTKLWGIRFKPAAFSVFFKFGSLDKVTDKTVAFEKKLLPDLKTIQYSTAYLNHFFLNKSSKPKLFLLPIIADIHQHGGQLNVSTLAQQHCSTVRQLERSFKHHIGISPKEFINIVRFQSALARIKNNFSQRSLLDIALECGYYDHSHLTNEIKRYTGVSPNQLKPN